MNVYIGRTRSSIRKKVLKVFPSLKLKLKRKPLVRKQPAPLNNSNKQKKLPPPLPKTIAQIPAPASELSPRENSTNGSVQVASTTTSTKKSLRKKRARSPSECQTVVKQRKPSAETHQCPETPHSPINLGLNVRLDQLPATPLAPIPAPKFFLADEEVEEHSPSLTQSIKQTASANAPNVHKPTAPQTTKAASKKEKEKMSMQEKSKTRHCTSAQNLESGSSNKSGSKTQSSEAKIPPPRTRSTSKTESSKNISTEIVKVQSQKKNKLKSDSSKKSASKTRASESKNPPSRTRSASQTESSKKIPTEKVKLQSQKKDTLKLVKKTQPSTIPQTSSKATASEKKSKKTVPKKPLPQNASRSKSLPERPACPPKADKGKPERRSSAMLDWWKRQRLTSFWVDDSLKAIGMADANEESVGNGSNEKARQSWSEEQLQQLQLAHSTCNPLSADFWQHVASKVEGKSSQQCHAKWFEQFATPKVQAKRQRLSDISSSIEGKSSKGGQKAHKRVRISLPETTKKSTSSKITAYSSDKRKSPGELDDIFQATPFRKGQKSFAVADSLKSLVDESPLEPQPKKQPHCASSSKTQQEKPAATSLSKDSKTHGRYVAILSKTMKSRWKKSKGSLKSVPNKNVQLQTKKPKQARKKTITETKKGVFTMSCSITPRGTTKFCQEVESDVELDVESSGEEDS